MPCCAKLCTCCSCCKCQRINERDNTYGTVPEENQYRGGSPQHAEIEELKREIEKLKREKEKLKREKEFSDAHVYREDVVFDPDTAHPRLEVSEDRKCVTDTGNVSHVSKSRERFDSNKFILAKDGFSKGKHYWEVEVGQKKNWILGVASERVCRTGIITPSPKNGYWVIQLEDGKEYRAQESRLKVKVNEKPTKIGMFLNIADQSLDFYDVQKKTKLYTFNASFSGTFYPFFSTGLEMDNMPLRIHPCIEEYKE